jgi:hypothetical protein
MNQPENAEIDFPDFVAARSTELNFDKSNEFIKKYDIKNCLRLDAIAKDNYWFGPQEFIIAKNPDYFAEVCIVLLRARCDAAINIYGDAINEKILLVITHFYKHAEQTEIHGGYFVKLTNFKAKINSKLRAEFLNYLYWFVDTRRTVAPY